MAELPSPTSQEREFESIASPDGAMVIFIPCNELCPLWAKLFFTSQEETMRKVLSILITIMLLTGITTAALAADEERLEAAVNGTAAYVLQTVKNPQVDPVGGEWAIIGLARSGYSVPDSYYEGYYRTVEQYVKKNGAILHDRKYTDNSRVILGLTAAGYDPRNVAGYDLTAALGDFERTIWQGINGPVWALIALDSFDYPIPENKEAETKATRELYVAEILRRQTPDGGWNLTAGMSGSVGANEKGDADLTGMALQALAKYQSDPDVKAATEKAISFLSKLQDREGGYSSSFSGGSSAIESAVQVVVALCELGIPVDDARFIKNGNSLIDNVLSFRNTDGSFKHDTDDAGNNQMSTEQALYALVAAQRAADKRNSLYRMSDTAKRGEWKPADIIGLPDKHADVNKVPVTLNGKTFEDISNHPNKPAIEALASRGIITGQTDTIFNPDATMTRAEFATITTRGLGLDRGQGSGASGQETGGSENSESGIRNSEFADVLPGTWYYDAVETAYYYEIVKGTSETVFNPGGTITRQEAAVMAARAAKLCGMDTERTDVEIRDTLAGFGDYRTVASWAQEAMAFCYDTGILDDTEFNIDPGKAILRCEVAEMMYRVLDKAELL